MYSKCSICGNKETWVAVVNDPKDNTHIYDVLCRDCYVGIIKERCNVIDKINDELENGWLKKVINLP